MNAIQYHLNRLKACKPALKWARTQDNPLDAWITCPRGDWLLWLALKLGVERRVVVQAACACARLALPFSEDERPLRAILLTERWLAGDKDVTLDKVKEAAEECREAALDAGCFADYAASNAAFAGMYTGYAATTNRTPKESAAAAAESAAHAAADGATCHTEAEAALAAVHQACANAVRSKIDTDAIMKLWWRHVTGSGRANIRALMPGEEDQP